MIPRPLPVSGCVDIWLLAGAQGRDCPDLERIALDPEEAERAERMATAELRAQARWRRRFLRFQLARYLCLAPEAVTLGTAAGGKPILTTHPNIHFSLSHSGDISVLAVGASPLGIDIERRKPFDRLAEVVAYTCSSRETADIMTAPDAAGLFLDRWVVKEAILKCRGTGLVENLAAVDPGPVSQEPTRWGELTVRLLCPPPGLARDVDLHIALAMEGDMADTNFVRDAFA